VIKGMLATLHGKFIQRKQRWIFVDYPLAVMPYCKWTEIDASTGIATRFRSIANVVQKQIEPEDTNICFPALAAWINAEAREWLLSWIRIAGKNNVLHISTDALLVTDMGLENLCKTGIVADNGIGTLRVVSSSPTLACWGVNNYILGDRACISGVPLLATWDESGNWKATKTESLAEMLSRPPDASVTERVISGRKQHLATQLRATDGGWIVPHHFIDRRL
jgi:hypothetical protein